MSSQSQEQPAQRGSFGSGYTLLSRQLPVSEPLISKRLCFYKSGDYTFNGHRMVINARTFKTFEALLDALSKKVPLAFGVRTITTPQGVHYVKGLDELYDGGSYVCSDQKRVKPMNLKELNRRQVPWNATRPVSARRKRREVIIQTMRKMTERVSIRTPKRLEVIKNRDPSVRRTIILQKRTAPTFDALLDYLSQALQFPVLKLYSTDGRRVDGLAALILCSGVVVAAGNESFRLANYRFQKNSQTAQAMFMETSETSFSQLQTFNNSKSSHGKSARKFSPSSESYIVKQINKSRYGNLNSHHVPNGSVDADTVIETCANSIVENQYHACVIPEDEDIEKSFRVNQDGSMTVEMKVRLKIKQEETLHWSTTLSRTSLRKKPSYPMISESANSSPDFNDATGKKHNVSEEETKEANLPPEKKSSVGFIQETFSDTPEVIERKSTFKRAPTPGPGHVKKKGVKVIQHSELHEMDQHTYAKRTLDKDTTEEYRVVRHSSSRSSRPIPKPRKLVSNNGFSEILQVEHDQFGLKQTVMHTFEDQSCDAKFVYGKCSLDSVPLDASFPGPDNSGKKSTSNDFDIDACWQPPVVDPVQHQNEEILSLSSEPLSTSGKITNNISLVTEPMAQTFPLQGDGVKASKGQRKRNVKPKSETGLDKKSKQALVSSKNIFSVKLNNKEGVKKSSEDSIGNGQKRKIEDKLQTQKLIVKSSNKDRVMTEKHTRSPNKVVPYNGHNVNVPDTKNSTNAMKKSISDILKPKKILPASQKTSSKSKTLNKTLCSSKKSVEIGESSAVVASVNPSPSEIHQYVENWLEKVSPEVVPYMDEDNKSQSKVEFQVGDDSEGEDKSQCQFYVENNPTSSEGMVKKSDSNLSVPLCQKGQIQSAVSEPTLREISQNGIRSHKSDIPINCASNITSNPKDKLQPVIRQICSSVICINRASNINPEHHITKSTSLPDFPSQVASIFGSSCKTFLSFLSMMTLRDCLTDFEPSRGSSPRISSDAMLMMESLQKISTIDNQKNLRASLRDLQNSTSSQLKEQWQDYQTKIEKTKTLEPGEDTVCQNMKDFGEQLGMIELMDELNMPADLRADISTAIQQAICLCPLGETEFDNKSKIQRQTSNMEGKNNGDEEEVASREKADAGNLCGLLDCQISMNVGKEKGSGDVEQASLTNELLKNEIIVEDSENYKEKDGDRDSVGSTLEDKQTKAVSEKNDSELEEEEDKDRLEDTDCNLVHGGTVDCEEVKEEHSQETHSHEEDLMGNVGDNLGEGTETESETAAVSNKCEEIGVGSVPSKSILEEASYLDCENSGCDVIDGSLQDLSVKSTSNYSPISKCAEENCHGSQSVSDLETRENCNLANPVEISQELLDFVNSALQTSSLIFTYDSQGNVIITPNFKPDKRTGRDSSYGFNCFPSPNTSELTDYRPESLESGGYKTQESLDIVTESEDFDKPFPVCKHSEYQTQIIMNEEFNREAADSKLSHVSGKSQSSLSSNDSGTQFSRGDLSDICAASSLKADNDHAPETEQCVSPVPERHSPDGVLIDHGRWLLKENHLIRKSPPVSLGMYECADNTSIETSVAEDSPTRYQAQSNPLTALSSSELEDMARPATPNCTYYNMPHGSDSDPFLDDTSIKSERNKVVDSKVEPLVQTAKTWTNTNGSLSSFTSVEFKVSDRKVHPEGEASSAVAQASRTSSGERRVVQAHETGETLQWRCNRYCPIL